MLKNNGIEPTIHSPLYINTKENYINKTIFIWKNNKKQRKLMIKEKCINY